MSSARFAQQVQNLYSNPKAFDGLALEIFAYQSVQNPLYAEYLELLNIKPEYIDKVSDIPCLPISFFKNNAIKSGDWSSQMEFTSSGTGGIQSRHQVKNDAFYLQNTELGFEHFFGSPADYCFLALLPSYLEREGSSLVYMLQHFISQSKFRQSGFYLNQFEQLQQTINECTAKDIPTILFGVPFGLLDFGELYPMDLSKVTIFETGGMKGRREELTKPQLYKEITTYFNPKCIYSEYGMTEMFSQAYSIEPGRFRCAPSMDIRIREINDPFNNLNFGRLGSINVVDLANFDTISFIATDDLGRKYQDGVFEVLGRMDNSDLRGCNLLIQDL